MKASMQMIGTAILLFILILDPTTALEGGINGIEVCLYSLVPVLFPFCVLTTYMSRRMDGINRILTPLGRLCKIPKGLEAVFPISFIAGYPIGASIIAAEYRAHRLSRNDAQRMIGFCSNAGISFVFGVLSCLFDSYWIPFLTMFVLILSGLITGIILPGTYSNNRHTLSSSPISLVGAVHTAGRSMVNICSWVILFSIIGNYLENWFSSSISPLVQCIVIGILEISNGVLCLNMVPSPALRWIVGCTLLSFGGICVTMQSLTFSSEFGLGWYIPGKILQASISCLLAGCLQALFPIFPEVEPVSNYFPAVMPGILALLFLQLSQKKKKRVEKICPI